MSEFLIVTMLILLVIAVEVGADFLRRRRLK